MAETGPTVRQGVRTSRFQGVYYCNRQGKWLGNVKMGDRLRQIGQFATEEEAAIAVDDYRLMFGASPDNVNFPARAKRRVNPMMLFRARGR